MRHSFLLIAAAVPCVLLAADPPIKMGLWETTSIMDMGRGEPMKKTGKTCLTPAVWQSMLEKMSHPHPGCTTTMQRVATGYTFKGTCTMGSTTANIEGAETIVDAEHTTGEAHSVMTIAGQKREISHHRTSRYLSSDCGSVKPDSGDVNQ